MDVDEGEEDCELWDNSNVIFLVHTKGELEWLAEEKINDYLDSLLGLDEADGSARGDDLIARRGEATLLRW